MRNFAIKILFLLLLSEPALSQQEPGIKTTKGDFSFSTGFVIGGPSHIMNKILLNAGYSYSSNFQTKKYLPIEFEITTAIKSNLRLGISICQFNQDLVLKTSEQIDCSFKTLIINPLISYSYKDCIFLNAGPSINTISYYHPTDFSLTNDEKYMNLGFTLKSILRFPKKTRVYLQFEAHYCFGGIINPNYSVENSPPSSQYTVTTYHADNLHMNFIYIGIGLGIRFFNKTS
jgi:hypothetical protein